MAQRFDKNNRDIRRLIPANIKLLRSAHGLSQETVAELTNLTRSCYCS